MKYSYLISAQNNLHIIISGKFDRNDTSHVYPGHTYIMQTNTHTDCNANAFGYAKFVEGGIVGDPVILSVCVVNTRLTTTHIPIIFICIPHI